MVVVKSTSANKCGVNVSINIDPQWVYSLESPHSKCDFKCRMLRAFYKLSSHCLNGLPCNWAPWNTQVLITVNVNVTIEVRNNLRELANTRRAPKRPIFNPISPGHVTIVTILFWGVTTNRITICRNQIKYSFRYFSGNSLINALKKFTSNTFSS